MGEKGVRRLECERQLEEEHNIIVRLVQGDVETLYSLLNNNNINNNNNNNNKGKSKVHPRTGHKGPGVE